MRDASVRPIRGVAHGLGVLIAAFLTSMQLMAGWGRVDWQDPATAWSHITFLAVIMAVGAAISDIIPPE